MVFSGKALLPVIILVGALIAASVYMTKRESQLRQSNMIARPMIGNVNEVNREGPWPDCVDMSYQECSALIKLYSKRHLYFENVSEGVGCEGFKTSRVCLYVDEEGIVTEIPHKG